MSDSSNQKKSMSKVEQLLGSRPEVSREEFLEKLWKLRPHGNVEDTYINLCFAIRSKKDFYGNPVTFDLVVKKYSAYVSMCSREDRPPQFIKTINSFIVASDFNMEFQTDSKLKNKFLS